jgi:hypothetical protein
MPELIACPACGYKVQSAETLLGRRVRCQNCSQSFVAVPDTSPPQPPSYPRPQPRRHRPPSRRDLLAEPGDGTSPFCPGCGKAVGWALLRCPFCGEEFEPAGGSDSLQTRSPRLFRRDSAPHRGRLLLALGNTCLLLGGLSVCLCGLGAVVSVPLGIITWLLANHDLAQMRTGALDAFDREETETGRTGAILGIVLGVIFAACHALWWLG